MTTSVAPSGNGGFLLPASYLSTQGSQIVDASGNSVRIASVGWNQGFDNIPASIAAIKAAGFNCVRVSWIDATMSSDLARIDQIVAAASAAGIKVILDHHTNEAGTAGDGWGAQQSNGLPYDVGGASNGTNGAGVAGTVTLQQYQDHWVSIAQHYANNPTVIGFDLTNEPLAYNGMSTWGSGNPNTDLQMIYSKVGSAIQAVNKGPLIICEGPQNYGSNFAGTAPAPWGDLSNAGKDPVTLTVGNKVVYSIHDYPQPIAGFATDSGNQAVDYMNKSWGYLQTQNIAPVWIGEMGGSLDGTADSAGNGLADEQAWAKTLLDYMNGKYATQGGPSVTGNQQGMSGDWWAWGNLGSQYPNGTLNGDGSLKSGQQAFWSQMLFTHPANGGPVSIDNTLVTNTSGKIVDASGNTWTITANKQVALNGITDTNTANVVELAWEKGVVWHENTSSQWYAATGSGGWGGATPVSPVATASPDNTVVTTSAGKIVDAGGNTWTITASAQVAVNGVTDPNTSNVVELAWEKGVLWQENASSQWYAATAVGSWGGATTTSPVPTVTPTPTASPDNTVVTSTAGKIIDASGNAWTITANKQVAVNGTTDPNTSNVVELAWEKGVLWQENASSQWYAATAVGSWGGATTTSPVPTVTPKPTASPDNTVVTSTAGKIIDASGNAWTITANKQVAVNGTTDPNTSNVVELAWEKGVLWQENASSQWYAATAVGSWGGATTTSPVPTVTPKPTASPDNTVVTSTAGKIIDASGNAWTITANKQVAVNGTTDPNTSNVVELAWEKGVLWQENASSQWYAATAVGSWGAANLTSPVPTAPSKPVVSPDNTVVTSTAGKIVDAGGNTWTITASAQVAVNGVTDTSTANVIALAWEKGVVWQENASKLWWSKTLPTSGWGPASGTATSPIPAAVSVQGNAPVQGNTPVQTPAGTVVGSGSDTIVLTMSEDADGPAGAAGRDAQFTVNVDGKQIGGLQTVTASHTAGQTQVFTFQGNYAPGQHNVVVTFANNSGTPGDKAMFNDGGDRNLYVNSISYDGTLVKGATTGIYTSPLVPPNGPLDLGNASFAVTDTTTVPANAPSTPTTTPGAVSVGTGADTLILQMAEDPYQGDAQFTVAVDGKQVGGTLTTTAITWQGQAQEFDLHGNWGTGTHTVSVAFTNDASGALDPNGLAYDGTDRNLYIKGVSYNGTAAAGTPWELASNGSHDFSVTGAAVPTPTTGATTQAGSKASSITLVPTSGTAVTLDGNTPSTQTLRTDTFSLLGNGVAKIVMGSVSDSLKFVGMSSVSLTNGRGNVTVTADGGANSFIAGKGALTVTGGTGADAFTVGAGAGALTINDFSLAKGDTLTLASSLKTAMQIGSDGHGGTAISFAGGAGVIDLKGVAAMPATAIRFS